MSVDLATMLVASAVVGYLLGAVPFPQLFVRLRTGQDLRTIHTGNVGVMNSMSVLGRRWGLGVLAAEAIKGMVAAWAGLRLGGELGGWMALVAAVVGANWSLWLRISGGAWSGGRGNTTFGGGMLVLAARLFVVLAAIYILARGVSGSSFVAARVNMWLMPLTFGLHGWWRYEDGRLAALAAAFGLAFGLIFRLKHSRETDDHIALRT